MPFQITPPTIDESTASFCKELSDNAPVYLDIEKEPYALIDECFPNVQRKIENDGGDIVYGWKVWLWPDYFIEGEFHAVWKSSSGGLVDITPDNTGETRRLFVPDLTTPYTGKRINNVSKNISNNRLVDDYLALSDSLFYLTNRGDNATQRWQNLAGWEVDFYEELMNWKYSLQTMIGQKKGPGSECPCGSGLKYKKCCAKIVRKKTKQFIKACSLHYI